jgi:peptide/nickel transport system permease protein
MLSFVVRRFLAMIPTVIIVMTVSFMLIHLIPGDPIDMMLGEDATPEDIARISRDMGLDRPLLIQFKEYALNVFTGNLGTSIRYRMPVAKLIGQRAEVTLLLTAMAMVVIAVFGVVTGVVAAARANSWLDQTLLLFALGSISIPVFWLGLILMLFFSVKLRWLPTSGYRSVFGTGGLSNLRYLLLPAVALGLRRSALVARMTRSSLLEVLREDYVVTARAKGIREVKVVLIHALRNAAIPVITVFALSLSTVLAGAAITESVFALPGVGRLVVEAVSGRDYPIVQGLMIVFAFLYLGINFLIDVAYSLLDPRIQYE